MKKIWIIAAIVLVFGLVLSGYALALNLPQTAKSIKAGKIKVGKAYGMEQDKRFHNIHSKVLGLECTSCHISKYAPNYLLITRERKPENGAPGVIDRGMCLSCHKENGPATTKLYGTAEK